MAILSELLMAVTIVGVALNSSVHFELAASGGVHLKDDTGG